MGIVGLAPEKSAMGWAVGSGVGEGRAVSVSVGVGSRVWVAEGVVVKSIVMVGVFVAAVYDSVKLNSPPLRFQSTFFPILFALVMVTIAPRIRFDAFIIQTFRAPPRSIVPPEQPVAESAHRSTQMRHSNSLALPPPVH